MRIAGPQKSLRTAVAFFAFASCAITACEPAVERAPFPSPAGTAEILQISQGTQGESGRLRIGVVSVRQAPYVDEAGSSRNGLVAALRIFVRQDVGAEITLTHAVHAGQRVQGPGYTLFVGEIGAAGRGYVRLLIAALP